MLPIDGFAACQRRPGQDLAVTLLDELTQGFAVAGPFTAGGDELKLVTPLITKAPPWSIADRCRGGGRRLGGSRGLFVRATAPQREERREKQSKADVRHAHRVEERRPDRNPGTLYFGEHR
jgi:hypothetical protein